MMPLKSQIQSVREATCVYRSLGHQFGIICASVSLHCIYTSFIPLLQGPDSLCTFHAPLFFPHTSLRQHNHITLSHCSAYRPIDIFVLESVTNSNVRHPPEIVNGNFSGDAWSSDADIDENGNLQCLMCRKQFPSYHFEWRRVKQQIPPSRRRGHYFNSLQRLP
jgi:hypothetical protein